MIAQVGDMGTATLIGQVKDKGGCDAAGGGWYYDNPSTPTMISLCTTTCTPLLGAPNSHLQVSSAASPRPAGQLRRHLENRQGANRRQGDRKSEFPLILASLALGGSKAKADSA